MSAENPQGEQVDRKEAFEITVGVPFKPFERVNDFIKPKEGEQPFSIPESYDYILLLQKKVSYLGVQGYVDVISEDIGAMVEVLVDGNTLEKPLGDVIFALTMSKSDTTAKEVPYVLRLSFIARSPGDYVKLLNSFVDLNIGDENYILVWNINRPCVKENLQRLESGEDVLVTEKNMFNTKGSHNEEEDVDMKVDEADLEEYESEVYGRVTFVWLPDDLDKLGTIQLTFNQFDDDNEREVEPVPDPSDERHISVPA